MHCLHCAPLGTLGSSSTFHSPREDLYSQVPTGDEYNTTTVKDLTITKDGKLYKLVEKNDGLKEYVWKVNFRQKFRGSWNTISYIRLWNSLHGVGGNRERPIA